jgi:glucose-1-phosphate cytidylyltransferase
MSDVTFNMINNEMEVHQQNAEPWKVTLVDTGESTMTGGRLKRVQKFIKGTFCLTYGDGLSNIDLNELISYHKLQKTFVTVTAIQPAGRFGSLEISGARVKSFIEKPKGDNRWISGGFFVCEPSIMNFIKDDQTIFEREPLEEIALNLQLTVWKHNGFWAAMDTLRDKLYLEELWENKSAPWKIW